jgi:protein TonB
VEVMPSFPGGSGAFQEYLAKHIHYPEEERQNHREGTVYVRFTVYKDGTIEDVQLLRGLQDAPGFGTEAVRVISAMPKWTPGMMNGKWVSVKMVVPIHFRL